MPPRAAHGGQIYGQNARPRLRLQRRRCPPERCPSAAAHVLSGLAPHLCRAHHKPLRTLWRSGYCQRERSAAPPLRSVPEFAEQHISGEWQGLDRLPVRRRPARYGGELSGTRPRTSVPLAVKALPKFGARVRVAVDRLTDEFRGRDIVAVAHWGARSVPRLGQSLSISILKPSSPLRSRTAR
jgi:hypothetical protein